MKLEHIEDLSFDLSARDIAQTHLAEVFKLLDDPLWNDIEQKELIWSFAKKAWDSEEIDNFLQRSVWVVGVDVGRGRRLREKVEIPLESSGRKLISNFITVIVAESSTKQIT